MQAKNDDLHVNVPDQCAVALILIDVINDMEFDDGEQLLIDYLKVRTVILAGFATDMCVLFTASDAYLRDLEIIVPPDCSAALTAEQHEGALRHMERVLHIKTTPSSEIDFSELLESSPSAEQHATTSAE